MSTPDNISINVPKGQGCIQYFTLEPNLPENGQPGDWIFSTIDENCKTQAIDKLSISFDPNSSWIQKQSEMCVLVITMNQSGWRFAMEGTKSCKNDANTADVLHDVRSEITGNGKVLTAYVKSLGNLQESIGFSFVAAHVADDGTTTVYQSPDPTTEIKR